MRETAGMLLPGLEDPPDRLALRFPERELTYPQLRTAAHRVAAAVRGQARVAVWAAPLAETAVAVVGGLAAGAAVVPVNPKAGALELEHLVADADPGAVVCAPGAGLPPALAGCRRVDVDLDAGGDAPAPPPEPAAESPALIAYTSGTTGPPKGAVLSRRAVAANLDALAAAWRWTAADEVVHGLPLFHVHGLVVATLGPLRHGGSSRHLGRFSPQAAAAALAEGASTLLFAVPTMYRRSADALEADPSLAAGFAHARLLVSGSAGLPAAEHERLRRLTGRPVLERYGMTETLMIAAVRADCEPRPGWVGPPLDGVAVRIVRDEVQVRGDSLFLGYRNRPDATAAATTSDGWFRTGDVAELGEDGALRLLGRLATDLIMSGGFKLGAGEIEAALLEHPAVAEAAVTGEPDPDLGERVVAWIVDAGPEPASDEELAGHVAALLTPHKRPRVVRRVDELPRNALGKVQKARLGSPGPQGQG